MTNSKKLWLAAAAIYALIAVAAGLIWAYQTGDDARSAQSFQQVAALLQPQPTPPAGQSEDEQSEGPTQSAHDKYYAVYEQNSEFVGWVSIEGTNIDYPVMQTPNDPEYYLKRNFDRQYSDHGVPFIQDDCRAGYSDNTILYGHHMKDGSMFSDLCKYADMDFYADHKYIQFDTLDGYGRYEIVAAFKTTVYDDVGFKYYRFVDAKDKVDFDTYIAKCKELAMYDTGVGAEYGDRLITLSTCEYSRENGRMVVVAKLVE